MTMKFAWCSFFVSLLLTSCTPVQGTHLTQTMNAEARENFINTENITLSPVIPPVTSSTSTASATYTPPATLTPSPTSPVTETPRPSVTATPAPTKTLSPDIYPVPSPFIKPVAWSGAAGCPNLEGLKLVDRPPVEEVKQLLDELYSGDLEDMRAVSDPAFWPIVENRVGYADVVEKEWIQIYPAKNTGYKSLIEIGCGISILDLSYWVLDCRADCTDPRRPLALEAHYFIINRIGNWLIWASYP